MSHMRWACLKVFISPVHATLEHAPPWAGIGGNACSLGDILSACAGFKLVNTETGMNSNYMADFGRSVFCFAATGAGWGVRLKLALMHGCIPVIVADHVEVGSLSWHRRHGACAQ